MNARSKTRRERYDNKKNNAKSYPISLCCINFMHDGNLGYLARAAACFGAKSIHVIGSIPDRKILNSLSGSLYDYVEIKQYINPMSFLDYAKSQDINLISAEICEDSISLFAYKFNFDRHICLVVGHEELGIPVEILRNSEKIYIPMPGVGFCLNTSQAANIALYEAIKQYESHRSSTAERRSCKAGVKGSNPFGGSTMGRSSIGRTPDC